MHVAVEGGHFFHVFKVQQRCTITVFPIEGEALTVYWATSKADYFVYGCDKLYIRVDHKPLLAFFRKVGPKTLDHIVNKRLRKYVSEINALRLPIFHIAGEKSRIRETSNLSTDADRRTDTILERLSDLSLKKKNKKNQKKNKNQKK